MIATRNHVLSAVPHNEQDALAEHLVPFRAVSRDILQRPGEVGALFFPETLVLSVLQPLPAGELVEVASIGCEGVAPPGAATGATETELCLVGEIQGEGWRIDRGAFCSLRDRLPTLRHLTAYYSARFAEAALLDVACQRRHTVEQRLARVLLATGDRSPQDSLSLTHETLSAMLGVYRPTVTHAMSRLRTAQLIASGRGHILILDRPRLEAMACDCYAIARRLLGRATPGSPAPAGPEP